MHARINIFILGVFLFTLSLIIISLIVIIYSNDCFSYIGVCKRKCLSWCLHVLCIVSPPYNTHVHITKLLDFIKALFQFYCRLCEVFHVSSNEWARSIDTVSSTLIWVSVEHFIHIFQFRLIIRKTIFSC